MFLAVKELKTLRQLKSFEVCWEMCGRWLCKDKDLSRLDKLVKKAGSVVSERLDPWLSLVEKVQQRKLLAIVHNHNRPPPPSWLAGQGSAHSGRLLSLPSLPD